MNSIIFARRSLLSFPRLITQTQTIRQISYKPDPLQATRNDPSSAGKLPAEDPLPRYHPPPTRDPSELAAQLSWMIERTASRQLPIYKRWRGGGTKEQIVVKKLQGDTQAFMDDMITALQIKPEKVRLNPTTRQVEITVGSALLRHFRLDP